MGVSALIQAVADKMASKKGRAGMIYSLLRDLAVFVRERSGAEARIDIPQPRKTTSTCCRPRRTTRWSHGGNVSAPGARRASFVTRALPVDCCR